MRTQKAMTKMKLIKPSDFLAVFKFLIAKVLVVFSSKRTHNIVVCELNGKKNGNGWSFFSYAQGKEYDVAYVSSEDDNHIKFGSIEHWYQYLKCDMNVVTHKGASPCFPLVSVLRKLRLIDPNIMYIQHGLLLNELPHLKYQLTRFKALTFTKDYELRYFRDKLDYPESTLHKTGMCRFDRLHDISEGGRKIFIFPTYRHEIYFRKMNESSFKTTEFFNSWHSFLNSAGFVELIESNEIEVLFSVHPNLAGFLHLFENNYIKTIDPAQVNFDEVISTSSLLLTDYSSIFCDFDYLGKYSLFFQFDSETFFGNRNNIRKYDDEFVFSSSGEVTNSIMKYIDERKDTSILEQSSCYLTYEALRKIVGDQFNEKKI